jgi:Ca2+-binding RTX toxin-like protein
MSISDTTVNPIVVGVGQNITPFSAIKVSDPLQVTETLSVTLAPLSYYYPPTTDYGTLTDPLGGGTFDANTHTFTESAIVTGTPTPATQILSRLIYTPPTLSDGSGITIGATVSVNNAADPAGPLSLVVVTPPAITGTVANEPVASGSTIHPFATIQVMDANFGYSAKTTATITLTDGGAPTDADGILTGNGLSKSGIGIYTIGPNNYYSLGNYLQSLLFTPTAVASGGTRTTAFELNVNDTGAKLSADDKTTSVLAIGPTTPRMPPLIAGTSDEQTVAPGNAISPFNGVTISDTNANPLDSATLTVNGGGTLSGIGLTVGPPGVYTIGASSPSQLTNILNKITFNPPPLGGQPSVTSSIALNVADEGLASSTKIAITEVAPPPPPPPPAHNFTITDETTGKQSFAAGDAYTGPVAGLDREIILITTNNLNITSNFPNVFIHSGAGTDALDVSTANGNNILDGSTGSNFLTGGNGTDTFFVDDRAAPADIWSTVNNFHAGDAATIWGVTAQDFGLNWVDGQGAAGFTGLTLHATAAGIPTASLTLVGYTQGDLDNGRLSVLFGSDSASGSAYMFVHGNS